VDLKTLRRARRRTVAPEELDQYRGRKELVRVQEQDRQQRTLPDAWKRQDAVTVAQLEWAKDPKLHPAPPR